MSAPVEVAASNGKDWETFPHGADVGVRGYGRTPAEAFANAALAMTSIVTDPGGVSPSRRVPIACAAPDMETLLFDWLNALVLEMAAEDLLFSRFEVAIESLRLEAAAWGEPIDRERHQPVVEVKGATYTTAEVTQDPDGRWRAQCVVDV
jgi:SHS2 domain-containing protein